MTAAGVAGHGELMDLLDRRDGAGWPYWANWSAPRWWCRTGHAAACSSAMSQPLVMGSDSYDMVARPSATDPAQHDGGLHAAERQHHRSPPRAPVNGSGSALRAS